MDSFLRTFSCCYNGYDTCPYCPVQKNYPCILLYLEITWNIINKPIYLQIVQTSHRELNPQPHMLQAVLGKLRSSKFVQINVVNDELISLASFML